MAKGRSRLCCLTIAGSDSGGGAGLQADLQVFGAFGLHGTSVVTSVTAQNPDGVRAVQAVRPAVVRAQLEAVFEGFPVKACKTGMLLDGAIIREVARVLRRHEPMLLVVDPVMVATSGSVLLRRSAVRALREELIPLATVVTPNIPEAEVFLGRRIGSPEAMRRAARHLSKEWGCAVLLKGGHMKGGNEAMDVLALNDGQEEWLLTARRVRGVQTHGTGCTYAAAICAGLAKGLGLVRAIVQAKEYVTRAIQRHHRVGRHAVLAWPHDR